MRSIQRRPNRHYTPGNAHLPAAQLFHIFKCTNLDFSQTGCTASKFMIGERDDPQKVVVEVHNGAPIKRERRLQC